MKMYTGSARNVVCVSPPVCCRAQLDVALRRRDQRWHCARSHVMVLAGGKAELFFYDTSPFILSYHNQTWAGQLGARPPPRGTGRMPFASRVAWAGFMSSVSVCRPARTLRVYPKP